MRRNLKAHDLDLERLERFEDWLADRTGPTEPGRNRFCAPKTEISERVVLAMRARLRAGRYGFSSMEEPNKWCGASVNTCCD